ncbi:hypothetical protein AG1IA_10437 [Rhizoctonia solani AG-1 IA]|uniref:Uncharacterized protein n=1 Tax=Thanatephorus cucumeris (strain AG1-IA) TaxID=983506 RepID=L8WFH0_THACA|nr:hypothetical protein AG1IA_10437 [Rhizoctonia solani AG-1 IA]
MMSQTEEIKLPQPVETVGKPLAPPTQPKVWKLSSARPGTTTMGAS